MLVAIRGLLITYNNCSNNNKSSSSSSKLVRTREFFSVFPIGEGGKKEKNEGKQFASVTVVTGMLPIHLDYFLSHSQSVSQHTDTHKWSELAVSGFSCAQQLPGSVIGRERKGALLLLLLLLSVHIPNDNYSRANRFQRPLLLPPPLPQTLVFHCQRYPPPIFIFFTFSRDEQQLTHGQAHNINCKKRDPK